MQTFFVNNQVWSQRIYLRKNQRCSIESMLKRWHHLDVRFFTFGGIWINCLHSWRFLDKSSSKGYSLADTINRKVIYVSWWLLKYRLRGSPSETWIRKWFNILHPKVKRQKMDAIHDSLLPQTSISSQLPLKLLLIRLKLLFSLSPSQKWRILVKQNRLSVFRIDVKIETFYQNCILQSRIQITNGNLFLQTHGLYRSGCLLRWRMTLIFILILSIYDHTIRVLDRPSCLGWFRTSAKDQAPTFASFPFLHQELWELIAA